MPAAQQQQQHQHCQQQQRGLALLAPHHQRSDTGHEDVAAQPAAVGTAAQASGVRESNFAAPKSKCLNRGAAELPLCSNVSTLQTFSRCMPSRRPRRRRMTALRQSLPRGRNIHGHRHSTVVMRLTRQRAVIARRCAFKRATRVDLHFRFVHTAAQKVVKGMANAVVLGVACARLYPTPWCPAGAVSSCARGLASQEAEHCGG